MIETTTNSLEEFSSASKTRKNPTGKQRHVVDAFRTVAWFNLLRRRSGAKSVYQMDTLLETRLVPDGHSEADCKSKWRSFRIGLHTPHQTLVTQIEESYEGSHALLNHVLWEALNLNRPVSACADMWIGRLHPEVQKTAWRRAATFIGEKPVSRRLNTTHLRMLERRAGLDALACLIILLRRSVASGDNALARHLSWYICRMLLILAPALALYRVTLPFMQYIEQEILPLASFNGQHYGYWNKGYQWAAHRLVRVVDCLEGDENRWFTNSERITLCVDILDGRRGDVLCDVVTLKPTSPVSIEGELY